MLAVPARLKNGVLHFQPPFTAPAQEVEVLVVFAQQPASQPVGTELQADFGAQFHWDKSLELTKDVGGKPLSQIVIEEREDNWR